MSDPEPSRPGPVSSPRRLLLLRHGEVASHRGDVPVTEAGLTTAAGLGQQLAGEHPRLLVLTAETRRARETADAIAGGARAAGALVEGPSVAFALRNPDLYLGGVRVDMVSTAAALAAQVPGMSEEAAVGVPFFAGFVSAPDRIGWWLRHRDPPGDDAQTVVRRITAFAGSLAGLGSDDARITVGVTHSPVLRACALAVLGHDPGEPDWLVGLEALIRPDGSVRFSWLAGAS